MLTQRLEEEVAVVGLKQKAQAYFQLLKFRLSITVAFSSAIGFMLGRPSFYWLRLAVYW